MSHVIICVEDVDPQENSALRDECLNLSSGGKIVFIDDIEIWYCIIKDEDSDEILTAVALKGMPFIVFSKEKWVHYLEQFLLENDHDLSDLSVNEIQEFVEYLYNLNGGMDIGATTEEFFELMDRELVEGDEGGAELLRWSLS